MWTPSSKRLKALANLADVSNIFMSMCVEVSDAAVVLVLFYVHNK